MVESGAARATTGPRPDERREEWLAGRRVVLLLVLLPQLLAQRVARLVFVAQPIGEVALRVVGFGTELRGADVGLERELAVLSRARGEGGRARARESAQAEKAREK